MQAPPLHQREAFYYLFLLCQRVRFRSFLCFFLRIFLRRFFTTELTDDHLLARSAYMTAFIIQ